MIVPEDARIKIRAEMTRCGYTVESLCQSADISQTVLRGILSGKIKEHFHPEPLCHGPGVRL